MYKTCLCTFCHRYLRLRSLYAFVSGIYVGAIVVVVSGAQQFRPLVESLNDDNRFRGGSCRRFTILVQLPHQRNRK